jgi:hypothetical protein
MAEPFEDLNIYVQKMVKQPLTLRQCERVGWALTFTAEAMAACDVPLAMRDKEMFAVAKELVEEFNNGKDTYPNAQTELVWTKRAHAGWLYSSTAGAAGGTVVESGRAAPDHYDIQGTLTGRLPRSGPEGLGKGNSNSGTASEDIK